MGVDLEGNLVDDFEEIRSLETLPSLRELTLSMNPVTQKEGFSREAVLQTVPQLEMLDDVPVPSARSGAAHDLAFTSDSASDQQSNTIRMGLRRTCLLRKRDA